MSQNGKGDKPCPRDWRKWDNGFDQIVWKKRDSGSDGVVWGKPKEDKKQGKKKGSK